jgi:hypothetical protein
LSSFLAEENAVKDGQFRIAGFKQQLLQLFLNLLVGFGEKNFKESAEPRDDDDDDSATIKGTSCTACSRV